MKFSFPMPGAIKSEWNTLVISNDCAYAELENIKQLPGFHGFENTGRQDYFNKEFGSTLEDMYDKNVPRQRMICCFL